jgi:hypothetical protein
MMKHIFYNGDAKQINVLDERFYESQKNPGVFYPSVTTILEAYYKGYGYYEWLKQVGFNADEIMRKAGDQGTNVHNMIESYLKGNKVNWIKEDGSVNYTLEEWQMLCKFIEFFQREKPEILTIEFNIVSESMKYGGTIDMICRMRNQVWLIDHKTSNYIHKTHELQLSAYATAWNELNPNYKIDRCGILWLKASTRGEGKGDVIQGVGWQLKEFDRPYLEAFKLFEHTQAIWNEENPNYKPKNLIYPSEFQLTPDKETN